MLSTKPVAWVGVAPSTTTFQLGLVPQCPPIPTRQAVLTAKPGLGAAAAVQRKARRHARVLYPYATEGTFNSDLGLINTSKVMWTGDPDGEHVTTTMFIPESSLGYIDPSETIEANSLQIRLPGTTVVNFGGSLGFIADEVVREVGFGVVPTDDDLARGRGACYTPVNYGWVHGTRPDGTPYYGSALGNGAAIAQAGEPEDVKSLVKIQKGQFWLQVLSTAAIATLATIAVVKAVKSGF